MTWPKRWMQWNLVHLRNVILDSFLILAMFQEEEEIEEAEEAQVEDSEEGGVRILIISDY